MAEQEESAITSISGEFIALRALLPDDAEITWGWRQSDRGSLLSAGAGTVEEQRAWIASRPNSEINWMIELRENKRPVGTISLVGGSKLHGHVEAGRFLIGDRKAVEGLPVAFEAMKLLYEVAFDRLGYTRVWGYTAEDNASMIGFHKYLGWTVEGRLREHLIVNGRKQDAVCLGILEREYRAVALPRLTVMIGQAKMLKERKSSSD